MRRVIPFVAVVLAATFLAGCYLLVDKRIRESAAIDYAVVRITVREIEAGTLESDAAVEVLKRLEPSMRRRVAYFESADPIAGEADTDGEGSLER